MLFFFFFFNLGSSNETAEPPRSYPANPSDIQSNLRAIQAKPGCRRKVAPHLAFYPQSTL